MNGNELLFTELSIHPFIYLSIHPSILPVILGEIAFDAAQPVVDHEAPPDAAFARLVEAVLAEVALLRVQLFPGTGMQVVAPFRRRLPLAAGSFTGALHLVAAGRQIHLFLRRRHTGPQQQRRQQDNISLFHPVIIP